MLSREGGSIQFTHIGEHERDDPHRGTFVGLRVIGDVHADDKERGKNRHRNSA